MSRSDLDTISADLPPRLAEVFRRWDGEILPKPAPGIGTVWTFEPGFPSLDFSCPCPRMRDPLTCRVFLGGKWVDEETLDWSENPPPG